MPIVTDCAEKEVEAVEAVFPGTITLQPLRAWAKQAERTKIHVLRWMGRIVQATRVHCSGPSM